MKSIKRYFQKFGCIFFLITFILVFAFSNAQTINFSVSADTVNVHDVVSFNNTSSGFDNATIFIWSYGEICSNMPPLSPVEIDTTICIDSITGYQSMTHMYSRMGYYEINLKAVDSNNLLHSLTKSIFVKMPDYSVSSTAVCGNVIQNWSFENWYQQSINCPTGADNLGWFGIARNLLNNWLFNDGTPDFYTSCMAVNANSTGGVPQNWQGYQNAHTGNGCMSSR